MVASGKLLEKRVEVISKVPFFEGIDKDGLTQIASYMKTMTIEPDEYVLTEGENVDGLYVIEKGFVNVIINKQVVRINIPEGDSFGEMSCLSESTSLASASVVAVDNVSALYIPKNKVKKLAHEIPALWEKAFDKISRRLFYTSTRFSEMLNHTHLMRIDSDGIITGEMSEICSKILGLPLSKLEKRKFDDLLFSGKKNKKKNKEWKSVFPLLFQDMSTNPIIDILPNETAYIRPDKQKVYLEFKYLPCEDHNGNFNMLHVQINDVTIKKMLEKNNERLKKEKIVRDRIYDSPDAFKELLDLITQTLIKLKEISSGGDYRNNLDGLKRDIHTIKGSAGLFCLDDIQTIIHKLEDLLFDNFENSEDLTALIELLDNEFINANNYFENIDPELRKKLVGMIVPDEILQSLKGAVHEKNYKKIKEQLDLLETRPVIKVTFGWKELIERLSEDLKKKIKFVTENTDNIMLNKSVIKKLSLVLVHIVRNSVFHGIEKPVERKKKGKTEAGLIKFRTELIGNKVKIFISDDGRGLDIKKIAKKAKDKIVEGKLEISESAIDEYISKKDYSGLISIPGLSTENSVGEISGRGIGTSSVFKTVSDLQGDILLEFGEDTGTRYTITIPID